MFTFSETNDRLEKYFSLMKIDDPARRMEIEKADIILLPDYEYYDYWPISEVFYNYCISNHPEHSIEYCYPTKWIKTFCSYSANVLLPTIVTSNIFLPTLLNIISGFLYDCLEQRAREREIHSKDGVYLPDEIYIEFKILVTKINSKSKIIFYKGPSKNLAESFKQIDLSKLFTD